MTDHCGDALNSAPAINLTKKMACFERTLKEIAYGRMDNGRALAAEISRQAARTVLGAFDVSWKKPKAWVSDDAHKPD